MFERVEAFHHKPSGELFTREELAEFRDDIDEILNEKKFTVHQVKNHRVQEYNSYHNQVVVYLNDDRIELILTKEQALKLAFEINTSIPSSLGGMR